MFAMPTTGGPLALNWRRRRFNIPKGGYASGGSKTAAWLAFNRRLLGIARGRVHPGSRYYIQPTTCGDPMTSSLKLPRGSFLLSMHLNGRIDYVPFVQIACGEPRRSAPPQVITLNGLVPIDAAQARRGIKPPNDVARALVIPHKAGSPPGSASPAYAFGCTIFDGEQYVEARRPCAADVRHWAQELIDDMRGLRWLPGLFPPALVDEAALFDEAGPGIEHGFLGPL